jgi:outer membrane murein-binding lipoprotein Lpp
MTAIHPPMTGTDHAVTAADLAAIEHRLTCSSGLFISHARTDVTRLLAEVHQLRRQHANLRAAAQAALVADRDGQADPLGYLRHELDPGHHRNVA